MNMDIKEIKKYKVHIIWGAGVVVALIVGILLGRTIGGTRSFAGGGAMGGFGTSAGRTSAGRTASTGGGFITGTVNSIDANSITVQLPNGNSEVVLYSSSTSVTAPTVVSISKITEGTKVMIGGSQSADGSLTAQTIQISSNTGNEGAMRGAGSGAGQTAPGNK